MTWKKYFMVIMAFIFVLPLLAEVSILSVTDEGAHTQKEDFLHTFEYYIITPQEKATKCQATRIAKNWFATAAHCVSPRCQNSCTIRMDLLEQPFSAFVDARHTSKKPIVFVHPFYQKSSGVNTDFALIHMNLSSLPAQYYRRAADKQSVNQLVPRKEFEAFLAQNSLAKRELNRVMHPKLPPILVFSNDTKRIDRTLSVISIFDGERSILQNPHPTDYVKELGFAYTQNFGIRKGMSGSGVMTNTGELAGIISGALGISMGGKIQKEYFMFPVFNADLLSFMQDVMSGDYNQIERRDASPQYVTVSPANHQKFIKAVRNIKME